ncbi:4121_t:CDS:2, partial [Dentiscutata erythropus]
ASIREHLFPTSSQLFADLLGRNLTDSIPVKILVVSLKFGALGIPSELSAGKILFQIFSQIPFAQLSNEAEVWGWDSSTQKGLRIVYQE